ncbi:MAG: 2-oxoacid:ferredoxin oxidoreductase subunit beta [Chloroflexota bacterium]
MLNIIDSPIEYTRDDYKGLKSTLCPGCGHDSISARIINVCFRNKIPAHQVIKLSGIGCSSKSPAYFLNRAHGFNALHGRMPSVATGALSVNRNLIGIGVSGDGDSGNIGLGQFKHMVRRNVPMVYIIENNGVYGLTKGQFSATADFGQELKYAGKNELPAIDLCMEALVAGCEFVARSFAGDARQVDTLLDAALRHNGTAVLDIISPCVTFNNDESSSKSYPYGKANEDPLHEMTFIPDREEIVVDYEPGTVVDVALHDGSYIQLRKVDDNDYLPTNRFEAMRLLEQSQAEGQFVTGLIYIDPESRNWQERNYLPETPLVDIPDEKLRPSKEALAEVMAGLM